MASLSEDRADAATRASHRLLGGEGTPVSTVMGHLHSPRQKLVYLYLRIAAGASAEDIKRALGMPLLKVYPVLDGLIERDVVERSGERYRCRPVELGD